MFEYWKRSFFVLSFFVVRCADGRHQIATSPPWGPHKVHEEPEPRQKALLCSVGEETNAHWVSSLPIYLSIYLSKVFLTNLLTFWNALFSILPKTYFDDERKYSFLLELFRKIFCRKIFVSFFFFFTATANFKSFSSLKKWESGAGNLWKRNEAFVFFNNYDRPLIMTRFKIFSFIFLR